MNPYQPPAAPPSKGASEFVEWWICLIGLFVALLFPLMAAWFLFRALVLRWGEEPRGIEEYFTGALAYGPWFFAASWLTYEAVRISL